MLETTLNCPIDQCFPTTVPRNVVECAVQNYQKLLYLYYIPLLFQISAIGHCYVGLWVLQIFNQ